MIRYVIKIGNFYVESFTVRVNQKPEIDLCQFPHTFALKFETRTRARVIAKMLGGKVEEYRG